MYSWLLGLKITDITVSITIWYVKLIMNLFIYTQVLFTFMGYEPSDLHPGTKPFILVGVYVLTLS